MRFASLGSGSRGNATLVNSGETLLLVDCGFSLRELDSRMRRLGVTPDQLDAILVTHEHSDHAAGVAVLSRAHSTPVFLTHGTASTGRVDDCFRQLRFNAGDDFSIGEIVVTSVPVPHDAREPVQFRFQCDDLHLGILTDLGSLTAHVIAAFGGCHSLLLEFNHDVELLHTGPYPLSLKRRVGGDLGHLNNSQAAEFLRRLDTSKLGHLVVGHISETNNSPELAAQSLAAIDAELNCLYTFACQTEGFDWIQVGSPLGDSVVASVASGA